MATTIKSIAKKAGVSYATVSLALNDDPRVAEKTRDKVKKLAIKLNYVPNNFGRALQSNKSDLVGCLLQNFTGSFFSEIFNGVGQAATANNYGLLSAICSGEKEKNYEQLKIFREKRVDGIVVLGGYGNFLNELLEFEKAGIPVIFASSEYECSTIPTVVTDNAKGGKLAAEHFIQLGHKRIAYAFAKKNGSGLNRYNGSKDALLSNGMLAPIPCADKEELCKLLKSTTRPTGIIAYSDEEAITIMHLAKGMGLRIPKDLSVIGFDDSPLASLPEFNLTTIAQAKMDIGRIAMEMLLDRINGKEVKSIILEPELIVRGSSVKIK